MKLTRDERQFLDGKNGKAAKKAMEILVALGEIYGADRLLEVKSVQIAGVSYHNLGDAGLEFLEEMAEDGKSRVLATLNPAGMDIEDWKKMGITEEFASKQIAVVNAFTKMGVVPVLTCTPYHAGNRPLFGEHIAWSESSAVCYANSILGARTNREGGPSALAAALTGRTPNYGMHLEENRRPEVLIEVVCPLKTVPDFGALGFAIGKKIGNKIPYIRGVPRASEEQLKSLCASIATYGGTAMFHMEGITPEAEFAKAKIQKEKNKNEKIKITRADINDALASMNDVESIDVDLVSVGCPHSSIDEVREIAELLKVKNIITDFWISLSRAVKNEADKKGYSKIIEAAGAILACDTCIAVAPLKGRFKCLATNSAKACYYGRGNNNFKTHIGTLEQCIDAAVTGKWMVKT
ncbi:MAG: aconitase X catalytic domain-containing protein [Candidatus Micrarchaeota archaeon]|nr:aconitase X catalytic domain-containing protein [Candidatus Micrarchaeota archaeon]